MCQSQERLVRECLPLADSAADVSGFGLAGTLLELAHNHGIKLTGSISAAALIADPFVGPTLRHAILQ